MSAPNGARSTPFERLAVGLFDGGRLSGIVQVIAATIFSGIVRTDGVPTGSFDLSLVHPLPATKAVVIVTGDAIGQTHNRTPDYAWSVDGQTLTVTFRDDAGAPADPAEFGVTVIRCAV